LEQQILKEKNIVRTNKNLRKFFKTSLNETNNQLILASSDKPMAHKLLNIDKEADNLFPLWRNSISKKNSVGLV